jgi:hypothetical protein
MKIKYKEPYWCNYNWEMKSNHKNQYVTEFNKTENSDFKIFQHSNSFIITCDFKIEEDYITDKISMVYGKPGKNFGLSYNTETEMLAFEFWNIVSGEENFYNIPFHDITIEDIRNGVVITIIKDGNTIKIYNNFQLCATEAFAGEWIEDYKLDPLYIGCSNPGTHMENHRYHGEIDIKYFSIVINENKIQVAKELFNTYYKDLVKKEYYENILCIYDFETINNKGIIYDESKHSNFLEKIPKEFVK